MTEVSILWVLFYPDTMTAAFLPVSTPEPWWRASVLLAAELMGWIGGPIIVGVLLGQWLDQRYGTEPWLFLMSVGGAFFVSTVGIIRGAMRELRRLDQQNNRPPQAPAVKNSNSSHPHVSQ